MPTGYSKKTGRPSWLGRKHSEEAKRRISEARTRRKLALGYLNSPEVRQKIAAARKGRKASAETRLKISLAHQGKKPKNFEDCLAKAHATPKPRGEANPNWKGDEVGYSALLTWVRKQLGKPTRCSACGTISARKYQWKSISGENKRSLDDWVSLCLSCHKKRNKGTVWNKGKKTGIVTQGAIKKGEQRGRATEFKKGQTPHNKGKHMPSITGERHPRWKGGVTEENHRLRTSLEYKQWRVAVFRRDHFTCVLCGYRSRSSKPCDIRADHIKPFCLYPELRFEVSNGRTLCVSCDKKHGWKAGRKRRDRHKSSVLR